MPELCVCSGRSMKILILGCGQVGSAVAKSLAQQPNNDVTVIDINAAAIQRLSDSLDIQTLIGSCTSPYILQAAHIEDCDLLLALTGHDETNLVACQLASRLYNTPESIARVRQAELVNAIANANEDEDEGEINQNIFDVSYYIRPEQLVTEQLFGLFQYHQVLQVLSFDDDSARLTVVQAQAGGAMIGKKLEQMQDVLTERGKGKYDCQVSAIYRNNRLIIPQQETAIIEGDEIYVLARTEHMTQVLRLFRPDEDLGRRVMIAGGGNIGYRLAKILEPSCNVKIIEHGQARAEWLADNLNNTLVLQGSATDESLLTQENIDEIDVFCALTNDDEDNVMSSLLANNLGAKQIMTIINRTSYVDLLQGNQIDIVVSPHLITIGSILSHIRRGDMVAVYPLRHGTAEAIEVILHGDRNTSKLVGRRLPEIKLPNSCYFAAVGRKGEWVMAHKRDWILQEGDHVIFFVAQSRYVQELEKTIAVKFGFF